MQNELEKVFEFHTTYGCPVSAQPTAAVPKELAALRIALMREEIDELEEAVAADDLVEIADALVDIQYFLAGTYLTYGIGPSMAKALFDEVHASNMSKLGADGKPILREDGKVMKGPDFWRPEIAKVLNREKIPGTPPEAV